MMQPETLFSDESEPKYDDSSDIPSDDSEEFYERMSRNNLEGRNNMQLAVIGIIPDARTWIPRVKLCIDSQDAVDLQVLLR